MTLTTQTVRELGFQTLECDIPEGMTVAQYRSIRPRRDGRPRRSRPRRRSAKR